jgi:hypothetical protein
MHHLIIIFLILISNTLEAKPYTLMINKPFNNELFDITQDYDRGITAVGFSQEFEGIKTPPKTYTDPFEYLSNLSASNGEKMYFVKTNLQGQITDNKILNLKNCSKAVSIVKTPSNGYFIGGYTLNGSLVVLKLDSSSNTIFSTTFGTKNYDTLSKITALKDGGVLVIATSKASRWKEDNIFESGIGLNDIYLTRFSSSGKKLWSKKYGSNEDDEGIDAVEAKDGSIVLVGKASNQKNQKIILMRITQNGNKIWKKEITTNEIIKAHRILQLRDGNFLLSLSQNAKMQKEYIRLIKFDLNQNIINDKVLTTTYSSVLKDIKEYSNSNLIGVGYVKDSYNTDALVMILNSKLEMLFQEHYGNENLDRFNAVTIMHNSQAAVAGISTDENSQEANMWITRVNTEGSMSDIKINNKIKNTKNIFEGRY